MTFCRQQHVLLLELLLRAMAAMGLPACAWTQLISHNSTLSIHLTQLNFTQLIFRPCPRLCSRCSASDDRRSRCSALCAEEHDCLCPLPPAPAQDYVQGAVLQMTGDQGAVLLCAEEHERCCPPPPLPKTMFEVQCFR